MRLNVMSRDDRTLSSVGDKKLFAKVEERCVSCLWELRRLAAFAAARLRMRECNYRSSTHTLQAQTTQSV
jgi:hypothetical protein